MPSLSIRQYRADSGALLSNISTLSYGKILAGSTSSVVVIDLAFTEVTNVGNVRLGLISSGGLTVNSGPIDIAADGSSANGHFGIESSSTFDSTKSASPLSRHFAGLNTTGTAANSNNVSIGNRTQTISDYIYLDIEMSSTMVGAGNGSYKIFFDYN
jgi:hypothetical protein